MKILNPFHSISLCMRSLKERNLNTFMCVRVCGFKINKRTFADHFKSTGFQDSEEKKMKNCLRYEQNRNAWGY